MFWPCVMRYGVLEIRNILRELMFDVATIRKTERSIVNFKSASTVLVETLNGGPILSIYYVLWTSFSGFYKFNVDAACLIEGDK